MEYLLLGPLEVHSAGERLPLGGPRQRALLADLALHAGSVVSMDTLLDDLWTGEPPPTAQAVVQNAIARLRRVLGRETIETRAPGYLLHADVGAIDARRFERLVRDARPLPPAERSAALRDALALWRGPPFADLAFESFLQDEIARLDELRLTALEDRLEAEVELGHHDAVVPEASRLAGQHPARERFCRLSMLALHRAGRQQEALDAYEVLRRSLDELFGLEPSPETRALQLMILNQDPAIAVGQERPPTVGAAVRRPVALLLAELLLDEELELEAAGSVLEDARRALTEVAARHGGSLSPESGVELIAAFGAQAAHEDDVLRAARAAVELHEMLAGREADVRLAVGTGRLLVEDDRPVLVGAVVGQTRRALRDAEAGDILVTPAAARLGGDALELDADGRLLGVRPGRPQPTVSSAPLVGRSPELDALRAAFDRAVETGRPQHVVVVGDAGLGKSRLVSAFVKDVPAIVLEAACIPYGEGISFLPLHELYDRAAALNARTPELVELTSADVALSAARALFEVFTASGALVVVLDDVHWAVPTFLDVVEYAIRAVDGPLLVVSASRPELLEQRPAWGETAITLGPLTADEARRLVDGLSERETLEESVATSILEGAAGVPLFLEQLAAHAAASGVAGAPIPPTLEALLASRVDALEPGERNVLSRAAVVGRVFSREAVGALTPEAGLPELDGRLASLGRRRLTHTAAGQHEFVHPLVHQAAYDAISRSARAAMHERLGRWLDEHDAGDELVGTHLERAALDAGSRGEHEALSHEASGRLGASGVRAVLIGDDAAAANLLERASALLEPNDPARLEFECMLGEALKGLGRLTAALELLEDVAERARAQADRRLELRALVEMVWPRLLDGSLASESAAELLDQATMYLAEVGDTLGVARSEFAYFVLLGDFGNRCIPASEHLARAEEAYLSVGVSGILDVAAVSVLVSGKTPVDDLVAMCHERMEATANRPRNMAYLRTRLAFLLGLRGDLDEARATAAVARQELAELGEEVGLRISVAAMFGSIEAFACQWEAAASTFESALEYIAQWESESRPPWRAWRAYFGLRMAEVALAQGDSEQARRLLAEARRGAVVADSLATVWLRRIDARVLARTGHSKKAVRVAREAVLLSDSTDDVIEQSQTKLDLGEVLLSAGSTTEALAHVREAIGLLDAKGARLLAAGARARFAEHLDEDSGARVVSSPAA